MILRMKTFRILTPRSHQSKSSRKFKIYYYLSFYGGVLHIFFAHLRHFLYGRHDTERS